jgi:predicted ATP-binding protein involved in virulence
VRIAHIEVEGLFGRLNHSIRLSTDNRVTVLTGLNGSGKTTVLNMVDILLNRPVARLRPIPFRRLALSFDDGSTLECEKFPEAGRETGSSVVRWRRGDRSEHFVPPEKPRKDLAVPINRIEDEIEELEQVGPELWLNTFTGLELELAVC